MLYLALLVASLTAWFHLHGLITLDGAETLTGALS
jgi:hypothetical protein